ncbi:MAG: VOC family protein [Alphaproteobacteria bacterium]|nr:VOC family protein [Alphaproteobacteria bacterium]
MERVVGVGGFFFRAKDPKRLAEWYAENLGVTKSPLTYDSEPWRQEAGVTVFQPFEQNTDYFGDASFQWMLNFRVRSLDRMVLQLKSRGIAVDVDAQEYPNGRFARIRDPEGNPIQLWEPAGNAAS